jgi:hypothetical protein
MDGGHAAAIQKTKPPERNMIAGRLCLGARPDWGNVRCDLNRSAFATLM